MIPKFRVWNKKTESFIDYGDLMLDLKNAKVYAGDVGIPEYTIDVTKQVVLMQYTGVSDKNGVEIFEGDIVRWKDLESFDDFTIDKVFKVEYSDKFMRWLACYKNYLQYKSDMRDDLYDFIDNRVLEVVGNIYENPELLEVKE